MLRLRVDGLGDLWIDPQLLHGRSHQLVAGDALADG